MLNVFVKGCLSAELKEQIPCHVAVKITECVSCKGSGDLSSYIDGHFEYRQCDSCNGYRHIIDLDTAIPCRVTTKTTVSIAEE